MSEHPPLFLTIGEVFFVMSKMRTIVEKVGQTPTRTTYVTRILSGVLTNNYDNVKLKYKLCADALLSKEEFFKIIVDDRFKHKDRIIKVYRDFSHFKMCTSMDDIKKYMQWASHFVPNTFYKWNDRSKENLRCIRWMTFDFELRKSNGKRFTPVEVYEIFQQSIGVSPTFVVDSSTSGNYHVYIEHSSLNGSLASVYLWERVQKKIQQVIGTDEGANGANHNFAIPQKNIYFFGRNTTDFNILKEWYLGKVSEERTGLDFSSKGSKVSSITEKYIWSCEAVLKLLEADFDGSRNEAGFTIALLFYAMGRTKQEAEDFLYGEWFPKVTRFPSNKPYRETELKASIRSAYSCDYAGPSREYIEALTGCEFPYKIYKNAYVRSKKHNKNENVQAIINFFRERDNKWIGTQKDLIQSICDTQESPLGKSFSFDSIKRNLRNLKEQGTLHWESTGNGGNKHKNQTEYILNDGVKPVNATTIEYNNDLIINGKIIAI